MISRDVGRGLGVRDPGHNAQISGTIKAHHCVVIRGCDTAVDRRGDIVVVTLERAGFDQLLRVVNCAGLMERRRSESSYPSGSRKSEALSGRDLGLRKKRPCPASVSKGSHGRMVIIELGCELLRLP